eukprot:gene8421-11389_t
MMNIVGVDTMCDILNVPQPKYDISNKSTKDTRNSIVLQTIPDVNCSKRQFFTNMNVEVTSLDIAPHGAFVVVGCGNGMILLYETRYSISTSNSPINSHCSQSNQGQLIGHIKAKGLHTNLLMKIKITDDCRFCFAGVMKGSSEMIAIDMGSIQLPFNERTKSNIPIEDTVVRYTHSDAKLRGFGAVTRLLNNTDADSSTYAFSPIYRLACGKGIKNVHVWDFVADHYVRSNNTNSVEPRWICIYDVATNGNTITNIGFRNGGFELLSKSSNANLRVWDLSKAETTSLNDSNPKNLYEVETPNKTNSIIATVTPSSVVQGSQNGYLSMIAKPSYEDIANTQDIKCLLPRERFAFGGIYEFGVVKIDSQNGDNTPTPKEANRDVFEMPERNNNDDDDYSNGLRRRRTMREIDEILSTDDGLHVLVLTTDGGVMYFSRGFAPVEGDVLSKESNRMNIDSQQPYLIELNHLTRDMDLDEAWQIRRVGSGGRVVLLRAKRTLSAYNQWQSCITVSLLSDSAKEEIPDTAFMNDKIPSLQKYYHDLSSQCYAAGSSDLHGSQIVNNVITPQQIASANFDSKDTSKLQPILINSKSFPPSSTIKDGIASMPHKRSKVRVHSVQREDTVSESVTDYNSDNASVDEFSRLVSFSSSPMAPPTARSTKPALIEKSLKRVKIPELRKVSTHLPAIVETNETLQNIVPSKRKSLSIGPPLLVNRTQESFSIIAPNQVELTTGQQAMKNELIILWDEWSSRTMKETGLSEVEAMKFESEHIQLSSHFMSQLSKCVVELFKIEDSATIFNSYRNNVRNLRLVYMDVAEDLLSRQQLERNCLIGTEVNTKWQSKALNVILSEELLSVLDEEIAIICQKRHESDRCL